MCGRYSRKRNVDALADSFEADALEVNLPPSYNVAPGQETILLGPASRHFEVRRWGLIPSWSKTPGDPFTRINARAETILERASYKPLLGRGRCLVPADGFFEWQKKQPFHFTLKNGEPFLMAALCDEWEPPQGPPLKTFTIITTDPNELVAPFHNRMPVIIAREDAEAWLDPNSSISMSIGLLRPFPADQMQATPVSMRVNDVKNNSPDLLNAVELPKRLEQSEFAW